MIRRQRPVGSAEAGARNSSAPQSPAFVDAIGDNAEDDGHDLDMSFRTSGTVNRLTIREQEKMMDELKKENFDLKLRVNLLHERLTKLAPDNIEGALNENVELRVRNDALLAEMQSYRAILNDAHATVESLRLQQQQTVVSKTNDVELARLSGEAESLRLNLGKAQQIIQKYEAQIGLLDQESRSSMQKIRQLELELGQAAKRVAEAHHEAENRQAEVEVLQDELRQKDTIIQSFRQDMMHSTSDFGAVSRQIMQLQAELRRSEQEREALLKERDAARRGLEKTEAQLRLASSASPRKSLDVLETKLMKELGQTTKKVQDLEKQTSLTQHERDILQTHSQTIGQEVQNNIKVMLGLMKRVCAEAALKHTAPASFSGLSDAVQQMESVCNELLDELGEGKTQCKTMETQYFQLQDDYETAVKEIESLTSTLAANTEDLREAKETVDARLAEVQRLHDTLRTTRERLRVATEEEIPRYRSECAQLEEKAGQQAKHIQSIESELASAESRVRDVSRKYENVQNLAVQTSSELAEKKMLVSNLQQGREELMVRLTEQENAMAALAKKYETLQSQLGHAEKVKSAVQVQFGSELQSLHSTNSELKLQLSVALAAKEDLTQRLDSMKQSLGTIEQRNEELSELLREREAAAKTLKRDHEMLLLEHKAAQTELGNVQATMHRLEGEVARLRREEHSARRNVDGLEHLNAKAESLAALNTFLKEQVELKETVCRELADKLKRQDEDMRNTLAEVDAQNRRLKKREQLIDSALKRLEAINYMERLAAAGSPGRENTNTTNGAGAIAAGLVGIDVHKSDLASSNSGTPTASGLRAPAGSLLRHEVASAVGSSTGGSDPSKPGGMKQPRSSDIRQMEY